MMDKRIVKALKSPRFACLAIVHRISPLIKSDELYLKIVYWLSVGKKLNLKEPKTFTEKLQWLKLYNRKPEYTIMVDKVKAKEYVAKLIGEEHIIPTLGVWDSPEEIDFDALPDQFVLKCNHNSGMGMCICRDKSKLDVAKVRRELNRGLKQDYYMTNREWPYKNVPRKIMAEMFMQDVDNPKKKDDKTSCMNGKSEDWYVSSNKAKSSEADEASNLTDYKFFCFNGEPVMMYVSHDNAEQATTDFFDMDYNRLPLRMKDPNSDVLPDRPQEFEEMKLYAKQLCKNSPFLRVDFYVINHVVYFGELTFFHNSGLMHIQPYEWDQKLGDMLRL